MTGPGGFRQVKDFMWDMAGLVGFPWIPAGLGGFMCVSAGLGVSWHISANLGGSLRVLPGNRGFDGSQWVLVAIAGPWQV